MINDDFRDFGNSLRPKLVILSACNKNKINCKRNDQTNIKAKMANLPSLTEVGSQVAALVTQKLLKHGADVDVPGCPQKVALELW